MPTGATEMKTAVTRVATPAILAVALVLGVGPLAVSARAQLGGLGGVGGALKKAQAAKQAYDDLNITDAEERQIGEDVSLKIRKRFGVVQDPAVHKYVSLVGTTLAKSSTRPGLAWTFIVLDTDGVNAFASPGGLVHITRGALGLIRNEGELAGVLAHEISHVTQKHTVNAIKKNKAVQIGTNETLSGRAPFLDKMANKAYEIVLENNFNRDDELDADKTGVGLTQKAGYAPAALGDFLSRLADRNKDQAEKNGLFASHPEMKERIAKIKQIAAGSKASALVEARYKTNVKYEASVLTAIATVPEGSAGLAGSSKSSGDSSKAAKPADEAPKKKGFGLGSLSQSVSQEKPSEQVAASGGARGLGPDRLAKGGANPALVKTTLSAEELSTFQKGIV